MVDIWYGKKVRLKTKEELINEGYEVRNDGVFKDTTMFLNESDLQYLGWKMKIEYKDSIYYNDNKYKGFSLSVLNGYEVDMYNIEPCMFKYIEDNN